MEQITVKVPGDTYESLEEYTESEHDGNRSEAIRELLARGLEYDDLENERDRLERQLAATNQRVDQHQELVEYVQEERDLQQHREERRDAPLWTRAKWYVFGRDHNNNEKSEA
ncbi:CopG family ribbon-helix-helix protein [Saliphagus infecundisoli]|uniref:CopG family ribbon-helix-helix protein n=1 Tax=Saliphagus infecundisoli TaxID=1849069 RepID=A0ABD5QLB5_9EURY|nr:ribbon-helix-helix protein, CopG family [Saliphagus infecundisoli]